MDQIKLINDNAIHALKNIDNNSVDLIIADPPYNLFKNYISTNDFMLTNDFIFFTRSWLKEAKRVLKSTGTIYVFMGMKFISYVYEIMEDELNLNFQSWITWHYTQGIGKRKGWSSRHDDILMFTKDKKKYTFNLNNVRIPQKYYRSINNMRGANPGNVWEFSHVHYSQKNRSDNPTQKPEGVIERMVLASSNPGDLVIDPFVGSGTTMRVVQQTNRRGIGIDIEPKYINETNLRLKKPFNGFDSIDERSLRIPNDLNDSNLRLEYFKNHLKWFLSNHQKFLSNVVNNYIEKYHDKFTIQEVNFLKELISRYNLKINKVNIIFKNN